MSPTSGLRKRTRFLFAVEGGNLPSMPAQRCGAPLCYICMDQSILHVSSAQHPPFPIIPGRTSPSPHPLSLGPTAPLGGQAHLDLNHGLASSLRGDPTNGHFLGRFQRIPSGVRIIQINGTSYYLGRSHGHTGTRVGGEGPAEKDWL